MEETKSFEKGKDWVDNRFCSVRESIIAITVFLAGWLLVFCKDQRGLDLTHWAWDSRSLTLTVHCHCHCSMYLKEQRTFDYSWRGWFI